MTAVARLLATVALSLSLAACGTLPGGGPSVGTLRRAPDIRVVNVTPGMAVAARSTMLADEKGRVDQAFAQLSQGIVEPAFRFSTGDVLDLTIWSFSPWPGGASVSAGNPGAMPLGTFTVDPAGAISLPYAGQVAIAGMTVPEAQAAIAGRYSALRILQRPTASLRVAASPHNDVLVTGAVGQPKTIAWTPAGITLAQAVTQALGDGSATLGQGDLSATRAAVRVSVLRDGARPVELPVAVALEERIPLRPGDRVVVRKAPVVEVSVLGGGARKNGVQGFAKQPVLAEALAEAAGLDSNTANDHAVFVLRRGENTPPTLYDFAWNRADGIVAAQQFPLENGDIVYVAESPIVSVQKVIGLLFQVTLPAQVIK